MPLSPDHSSSDLTKEREDLEELLQSPGWQRFVGAMLERYTGPGYYQAMKKATNTGSIEEVKLVQWLADEAMVLTHWPMLRVRELRGDTE